MTTAENLVYNSNEKYLQTLLDWGTLNRNFDCVSWQHGETSHNQYLLRIARAVNATRTDSESLNRFWFQWLKANLHEHDRLVKAQRAIAAELQLSKRHYMWVTVSLDETKHPDIHVLHSLAAQFCKSKYILTCKYVHEKHTSRSANGIHHHTHYLVETTEYVTASKFIESISRNTLFKKYVAQNCIHIQTAFAKNVDKRPPPYEVCMQYLRGEKKPEKMDNVIKDQNWRVKNGMEQMYEYVKV